MASTIRAALRFHARIHPSSGATLSHLKPRHPQPRFASSSSPSSLDQAQKNAQNAYSSASKHAGNAFQKAQKLAGPIGERIANMLGAYRAPLSYNLSVARELLKQVYMAERLQPPLSLQTWSNAYTTLAQRARNPNYWREILNNGEYAKVGLYALEAYTIFKIGEIIGRRSLVGYKLQ
ncbi:mitochondrial ATP synthase g subunit-domain-containing protein [Gautieria morchelliformis]|nr:mitochondrial ATP synthase g subunit-domain-containing protein [Gautieria morchelliformis]